jgi:hypothetical protein
MIMSGNDQEQISHMVAEERDSNDDLPDDDIIVVRARTSESQDEDLTETEPAKTLRDAGESVTERQSRSERAIRLPQRYQAQQVITDFEIVTLTIYDEAMSGSQKKQWEIAIAEELGSLAFNDV